MNIVITGKILNVMQRHLNGDDTALELNIYYNTDMEDIDGEFVGLSSIALPLKLNEKLSDPDCLENKKITISVNIE